jgi:hypothetical protein
MKTTYTLLVTADFPVNGIDAKIIGDAVQSGLQRASITWEGSERPVPMLTQVVVDAFDGDCVACVGDIEKQQALAQAKWKHSMRPSATLQVQSIKQSQRGKL